MISSGGGRAVGGLRLHTAERADVLVEALAEVLSVPLADPFAREVVAVPTRGVERWVAQRLSHTLGRAAAGRFAGVPRIAANSDDAAGSDDEHEEGGVCANVVFDPPARLVAGVLAAVVGVTRQEDPWRSDRLAWAVLDAVDACAHEPWCAPLGRHLGVTSGSPAVDPASLAEADRRDRRMQTAQHLAALFDSYAAQRPVMVRAWAAGRDEDGTGEPLPADLVWQAELWRRVRHGIGSPSPAERLDEAVRELRADPGIVELPERISVFGPTRLSTDQVEVLHALSAHRAVHLWLPHPSPVVWRRTGDVLTGGGVVRRRALTTPAEHPLLASMARDAIELQTRLQPLAGSTARHGTPGTEAGSRPHLTLLEALQHRLRQDDGTGPPTPVADDDRSVQVHACHGRARQVEVLREALLGLFADDPSLEPRDVVVMCPDIETFAPLISATFGLSVAAAAGTPPAVAGHPWPDRTHPGQTLRVSLADRSLRQTNPVLALIASLLDLADSRVTASAVLDLAATPPVRQRFLWKDDDLDRIRDWSLAAGVRWGENEARRRRFGLERIGQGTWQAALERLLLGVAMADEGERFIGTALPLDDVDSNDVDLAGRFSEFVERLTAVLASLDGRRPATAWFDALDDALNLLAAAPRDQPWQEVEARAVLADARRSARDDTVGAELALADVRALLGRRLRGRPTRAGFRTGSLTVCSLEPMRSVPHRVVCLLGMDDGAFPRGGGADGDDVLQRDPLVGDRDRRLEDRQLFLDAVTAAGDHLVVLFAGADERTGAVRPPAVPVSELLDAVDLAATCAGRPARTRVVVRHPLQTFDERNFTDGALGAPGPFSFDPIARRAAETARRPRSAPARFLPEALPPMSAEETLESTIDLDALITVLDHPVRGLVRTRLGVLLPREAEEVEDRLPLELPGLEEWQVGDRLLTAALSGVQPRTALAAERRRGHVPPGALGTAKLHEVGGKVDPIDVATRPLLALPAHTLDALVDLPGSSHVRHLTGTITDLHGDRIVRAVYSRLAAKHRLRAWLQLLCAAAAAPDRSFTAVTIGRGMTRRPSAVRSMLFSPPSGRAVQLLCDLVELHRAALREPLPFLPAVSEVYARGRLAGDDESVALAAARKEFEDGFETAPGVTERKNTDAYHDLVWGERVPFGEILGVPSAAERRSVPGESTRFGVLARRVWDPLLSDEQRGAG